ncbi:MAG TPA: tetratricopeptide repeat protein [Candidatus Ozemobacteraceae bacterium]
MRMRSCLMLLLVLALAGMVRPAAGAENGLKECRALEQAGKFEEALAKYLSLIEASPSEELYRETGSLLGKLQRYDEADALLKKALTAFPKSTSLMNLQALITYRRGRSEEARAIWNGVLALDPDNAFARDWVAKLGKPSLQASGTAAPEPVAAIPATAGGNMESGSTAVSPDAALSPEEQQKLAKKLYQEMYTLDKWETARFEELHRQVIDKCPTTEEAVESCWRLSNLYLMADDKPRYEDVIQVLEHLIAKYPTSPVIPDAKNRLMLAYKEGGHPDKLVTMYQELFKLNPNPDDRMFMIWGLEYADALAATGKTAEANSLYEQVIERDGGKDQLEARVARERLGRK